MITRARNIVVSLVASAMLVGPVSLAPVPVAEAQDQNQRGLVNVAVGNLLTQNNLSIGAAAQAVANVCPNLSVGNVAALAAQANATNAPQTAVCEAVGGNQPITITPSQSGGPGGGGQNQNQRGLVNVAVGNLLTENNVSIGAAAQAVANICPNLSVGNIAALAAQANATNVPQTAVCEAVGGNQPITITPST